MENELDYYYKIIIASLEFELAQEISMNSIHVQMYKDLFPKHSTIANGYLDKKQLPKLKKMWGDFFEPIREQDQIAEFDRYLKNNTTYPLCHCLKNLFSDAKR